MTHFLFQFFGYAVQFFFSRMEIRSNPSIWAIFTFRRNIFVGYENIKLRESIKKLKITIQENYVVDESKFKKKGG